MGVMKSKKAARRLGFGLVVLALAAAFAKTQYATFEVVGDTAYMSGELGAPTPRAVKKLFRQHPDLATIVMNNVPGSEDDDKNIKASLRVFEQQLTTYVPADGVIASGGVDFFLAGKNRIVEEGACVGVHAWQDDNDRRASSELPRDHQGHKVFLDYFRAIGMNEAFYWFTLEAAPFDGMYWMSTDELLEFGVVTEVIQPEGGAQFQLICDHR